MVPDCELFRNVMVQLSAHSLILSTQYAVWWYEWLEVRIYSIQKIC